ncbi:MAG: hypothetical protein R3F48_12665 [Candidatus Zixiibacteriota bacterium]
MQERQKEKGRGNKGESVQRFSCCVNIKELQLSYDIISKFIMEELNNSLWRKVAKSVANAFWLSVIATLIVTCAHKPEVPNQKIEDSILEKRALAFAIPFLEKRYELKFDQNGTHYIREDNDNGGYLEGDLEISSYSYGHPDSLTGERPNYVYVVGSSNIEELWEVEVVVPRDTTKSAYEAKFK